MNKSLIFRNIRNNFAFTPERGDPGYGKTFVKKENGICPAIDRGNKSEASESLGRNVFDMESIFHPFDRVYAVNAPSKILFHYR